MRVVVDSVIFAVWLAFWIYWLAASVGVKARNNRADAERNVDSLGLCEIRERR